MHDSHLPLRKWFGAIYLMSKSRKGIAAYRLQELLGIGSYKTAWYLCHRVREAMGNDPFTGPTLVGIVEVDETLIGGRTKGKGAAYKGNKTWVAGAIQRGGQIRLERIPNIKRKTLHGFIGRTVKDEAEAYTDELKSLALSVLIREGCSRGRSFPTGRRTTTARIRTSSVTRCGGF